MSETTPDQPAEQPAEQPAGQPASDPAAIWKIVGLRLAELAILGGLSAGAIYTALTPALTWIAGAGGGLYASRFFGMIRGNAKIRAWVDDTYRAGMPTSLDQFAAGLVGWLFFSPATAAAAVAGFSAIFSAIAVGIIAYFDNQSLSAAWSAFLAFLFSQLVYFLGHPAPEPQTAALTPDAAPEGA